jgi:hypothetical protein
MFTPLLIAVICLATPTPNRTANPPASMATSESDIEFAVLRTALAGLHRQDHDSTDWAAAARTLRLNARAFTNQFPSDPRGLELEATLSMRLEEDQAVDSAFAQLLRLAPKKTTAGTKHTRLKY